MINFSQPLTFLGISMYAICILIGIVIAVYMGLKEGKKLGIYSDFIFWGVIICVPLAIIGARLWYVIFNLNEFDGILDVLGITGGGLSGLAIQGGIIVALIFVYFWSKKHNIKLYRVFDILAPGLLIGQICGRWGNFFNGELYGPAIENVKLFKALLPSFITENMIFNGVYHHPAFLYESLLNLVGLIIILVCRRKFNKLQTGDTIGFYLTWYGFVRIFTECLRLKGDPSDPIMLGSVPVSILISVIFVILGIVFLVLKRFYGSKENYLEVLKNVESNKFKCVLFDLDGTLLNTKPLIDASFIHTFEHYFPEHDLTDEELESFFGPTLKTTFKRFSNDPDKINELIDFYRKFNIENHDSLVKPFDGCLDLIKLLHKKGYKVGVVSSKKNQVLKMGTDLAKITPYLDVIIGEEDITNPKPDPEGIKKAINKLGLKEDDNVLYVGDHPSDIKAGKAAGIKTCGCLYSSKWEEVMDENPDYDITKLSDIKKILVE